MHPLSKRLAILVALILIFGVWTGCATFCVGQLIYVAIGDPFEWEG